MAPKPEPEDIANADALMAAPWLVCESGPDPVAGIPAGMDWNWSTKQFEARKEPPTHAIILFDEGKQRGKLIRIEDAKLSADDKSGVITNLAREDEGLRPYAVAFRNVFFVMVISHRRTTDGRFLAIVQTTGNTLFLSLDPNITLVPLSCAPSADDSLTPQIEQARAEWLAAMPKTESPQQ